MGLVSAGGEGWAVGWQLAGPAVLEGRGGEQRGFVGSTCLLMLMLHPRLRCAAVAILENVGLLPKAAGGAAAAEDKQPANGLAAA
jgi:hypothetical protein